MCDFAIGFAEGNAMNIESIIMLIVTVLMGVYLLYALLRPERF
jgi:K+-transporting ATPase KdpF subunit